MAARLKVFTWTDGFHAFTVATSSRAKALQAWGVEQDLFKTGLAHQVSDDEDAAAALAEPGTVIVRHLVVDVGEPIKRRPSAGKAASTKARQRLEATEARLAVIDAEQAKAMNALKAHRQELDRKIDALERDQTEVRCALEVELKRAREAAR